MQGGIVGETELLVVLPGSLRIGGIAPKGALVAEGGVPVHA